MSLRDVAKKNFLLFFVVQLFLGSFFVTHSYFDGQESLHQAMLSLQTDRFIEKYNADPNIVLPNDKYFSVYKGEGQLSTTYLDLFKDLDEGYYSFDIFKDLDESYYSFDLFDDKEPIYELEVQVMIQTLGDDNTLYYFVSALPEPQRVLTVLANIGGLLAAYIGAALVLAVVLSRAFATRLATPLIHMSQQVQTFDSDSGPSRFRQQYQDGELGVLAKALDDMSLRVSEFIKRERDITRNISHELRTPITVLKSSLALIKQLKKETDNYSVTPDQVQKMERCANDLQGMIEAILWLAREQQLPEEPINCGAVVERALLDLEHLYTNKPISLNVKLESNVKLLCAEKIWLIAVSNLLRNAFSYTEEGYISVELDHRQIIIEDTGIGFNTVPDKAATENTIEEQRFGFGLYIVKQICQKMSWTLLVSVSSVTEGTVARIIFKQDENNELLP